MCAATAAETALPAQRKDECPKDPSDKLWSNGRIFRAGEEMMSPGFGARWAFNGEEAHDTFEG
jgi:hypothetical protein